MARISNTTVYPVDTQIDGNDRLLGTDAASNSAMPTRSYTISDLAEFINPGNLLTEVPPQFIPIVHEHSNTPSENRVETGPIKLTKVSTDATVTNLVLSDTAGGNSDNIELRIGNASAYLVIQNPTIPVDFKSLEGLGFTGSFGGIATPITGTITTFPSTQVPTGTTTDWVIDNNGNTEWWFDVTTSVTVNSNLALDTDLTFNSGTYDRWDITYIGDATFIDSVGVDGNIQVDGTGSITGPVTLGDTLAVTGNVSGANATFTDIEADTASIGAAEITADSLVVTGTLALVPVGGGAQIPVPNVRFEEANGTPATPSELNMDGEFNLRDSVSQGRSLGIDWSYDSMTGAVTGTTALPNIGITDIITTTAEADDNTEGEALDFLYNNLHMDARGINHPWHRGDMALVSYSEVVEVDAIRNFTTGAATVERVENTSRIRFENAAQATRFVGLLDADANGAVDAAVAGIALSTLFNATSITYAAGTTISRVDDTITLNADNVFGTVPNADAAPGDDVVFISEFTFTNDIVENADDSITIPFLTEAQALEFQRYFGTGLTNSLSTVAITLRLDSTDYTIPVGTQIEHAAGSVNVQVHAGLFDGISATLRSLQIRDTFVLGTEIVAGSNIATEALATTFTQINLGSLANRNSLLTLFRPALTAGPSVANNVALRFGPTLIINTTQLAALTPAITLTDGEEYAVMVETDPLQVGIADVIRFTFDATQTTYELTLTETVNAGNIRVTFLDLPNDGSRLLAAGAGYTHLAPVTVNVAMDTIVQPGTADEVVEIAQDFNLPATHAATGVPLNATGINEVPRTLTLSLLYIGTDQGTTAANTVAGDWINITPAQGADTSLQGVTVLSRAGGTVPPIVPPAENSEVTLSTNRLYVINEENTVLRLPAQPTAGSQVLISNISSVDTNTVVINNPAQRIEGSDTPVQLDDPNASFHLIYSGDVNVGWVFVGMQSYTRLGANVAVPAAPGLTQATMANPQQVFGGQTIVIPAARADGYFYTLQNDPDSGDTITIVNRSGATGGVTDPFPSFTSFTGMTNTDGIVFEPIAGATPTDTLLIDTPDTFMLIFNGNNNQWIIS